MTPEELAALQPRPGDSPRIAALKLQLLAQAQSQPTPTSAIPSDISSQLASLGINQGAKAGYNALTGSATGAAGSSGASGFLGTSASPVLYDATTGQAVASSASGVPGLTSSGASALTPPASQSSLLASIGIPAAVAAGTYLTGKSAYDMIKGRKDKSIPGLIGRGSLAMITAGGSEVANALFNKKSKTKVEEGKWKELKKAGKITDEQIPQWVRDGVDIKGSGYRNDLASDFVGTDSAGAWANNKFAQSRNESDLTVTDIQGFADAIGRSQEELQRALDAGAVRERKGTVDIDWSKVSPPNAIPVAAPQSKPAMKVDRLDNGSSKQHDPNGFS